MKGGTTVKWGDNFETNKAIAKQRGSLSIRKK
jgi:hypothetical protein